MNTFGYIMDILCLAVVEGMTQMAPFTSEKCIKYSIKNQQNGRLCFI